MLVLISIFVLSCGGKEQKEAPEKNITVPKFNQDSAYFFVAKQVKFGPRVPNSKAHRETGNYLIGQFKKYGAAVTTQEFEATTFGNHKINLRNIIASFSPERTKRVLLAAHWDTRPFADKDKEKKDPPFDGANDGASGVGILLEIARVMQSDSLNVGVDFILFDGEDWGEKENQSGTVKLSDGLDSWWCLGSQHWARHKHKQGYSAYYGVLLDMVGARHAHFYREETSLAYAPRIVAKVWDTAERLGYTDFFIKQNQAAITDDHEFVNKVAKIPMIDIVDYQPGIGYFGDYHHTTKDNLDLISKETLGAVGNTLLNVLYYEEK
jgi:hypothetical protein